MRNDAWNKKQLNTFISSWTELKHDTLLYTKQVMAEMGTGGEGDKYDDRGYVEPVPVLYHRVAGICKQTIEVLKQLDMLNKKDEKNLTYSSTTSSRATCISGMGPAVKLTSRTVVRTRRRP